MSQSLPTSIDQINIIDWQSYAPFFADLTARALTADSIPQWLQDWSTLTRLYGEADSWVYIQKTLNTADEARQSDFLTFVEEIEPKFRAADQKLKERLITLNIDDPQMALVMRNMRSEADLFREENLPLLTEEQKLVNEYDSITGSMSAEIDGESLNVDQLSAKSREKELAVRLDAWRGLSDMWLSVREPLNDVYTNALKLRIQIAQNAGFSDYRSYVFRQKRRFDYTPEDCKTFHKAIEEAVVPAVKRIMAKKAEALGEKTVQPWNQYVDPSDAPVLKPYQGEAALTAVCQTIFNNVSPELGNYFKIMADENLLDLDTRHGKALGGYCIPLLLRKRPFIFMNGVGTHDNVQTMLHECGHAFHDFESSNLPLTWQGESPMEFAEVASMSMELLASPNLTKENGGFYSQADAARARIEHLQETLAFLPYMAVVDAFQHWVYENPDTAQNPANLDAKWSSLWDRFMPFIDYGDFQAEKETGWQRKLHITQLPFYYIEYGMAQIGALQVWRNSLTDHAGALADYRHALALGGTKTLPELFQAAGAEFRFDTTMLTELVTLAESTINELSE